MKPKAQQPEHQVDENVIPPRNKPTDPLSMLMEIEAYLTFRLIADDPFIPKEDMQQMKEDLAECLRRNGVEVRVTKRNNGT